MRADLHWIREWKDGEQSALRVGRRGTDLIAHWPGLGTLIAAPDGSRASFWPEDGADPSAAEKLQRCGVPSMLAHLRGEVTLHASCVAAGGRALGFLGIGGSGKSTTTAAFVASGRASFVADDCLRIHQGDEGVLVQGADDEQQWLTRETRRWLGLESYTEAKIPVPPPTSISQPVPLVALFCMKFDERLARPALRPASPADAFRELSLAQIRFALDDPRVWLRDFEALALVLARVPVYELARPRDLSSIASCLDLAARFAKGAPASCGGGDDE